MFACNPVRLSLESIKGSLLSYLLTDTLELFIVWCVTLEAIIRKLQWIENTVAYETGSVDIDSHKLSS